MPNAGTGIPIMTMPIMTMPIMTAPLSTGYNISLVCLSIVVAMVASYTALDLAGRVRATQGRVQMGWLLSGATTMGLGIWSMHFIGMLAFRLPLTAEYHLLTVLVSILPAIGASTILLFLVSRPRLGGWQLLAGSLCMGSGIAGMHYVGMTAMQIPAVMAYDRRMVLLSVFTAMVVSLIGLFLVFQLREEGVQHQGRRKLLAAMVMGAAIPAMHYIGMAAVRFAPTDDRSLTLTLQPPANAAAITATVALGTLMILGVVLLTAYFDRRLSAQAVYTQALQESQAYLKTILQGVQAGILVIEGERIQLSNQMILDLLHLSTEAQLQALWEQALSGSFPGDSPSLGQPLGPVLRPIVQKILTQEAIQNEVIQIPAPFQPEPTSLLLNTVSLPKGNTKTSTGASPVINTGMNTRINTGVGPYPTQIICTFSEISELKHTENRLKQSEAQFRELAQQEEILNHLSSKIRQSLDLQIILQTTVSEVRQFFATDRALVYQFNPEFRGQVVLEDLAEPWCSVLGQGTDDCFSADCLAYYQRGGIRAIHNILEAGLHPDHLAFLQGLQVKANLIVSILVHNQLWGLLILHQCSGPRVWQEKEGNLLARLAIQLGIAIQQADLYGQAEQNALQAQAQAQELQSSKAQLQQQKQTLQKTLDDRQKLELQLIQSEKMSSLGQLVAGVAHEINNPISFIHGNLKHVQYYAQDLLDLVQVYQEQYPDPGLEVQAKTEEIDLGFLQDDLPKSLDSMQVGSDRIREIVLSLRTFSRMDEAELKTVDIHEGIDSTLMILQHRLKPSPDHPAIEVMREYGDLPCVACYPGQLNQVFMNILANGIDALEEATAQHQAQHQTQHQTQHRSLDNPEHSSRITIQTAVLDNHWAQITIADNGCGMSEITRQRVFDPFFTTKPTGKGTGMGLSISYKIIVEAHHGRLQCFSIPNQGTTFQIQIPIDQEAFWQDG
jgi:NO-binding membrane sensor protein with MHYT domain/signal transduction histidine kinase